MDRVICYRLEIGLGYLPPILELGVKVMSAELSIGQQFEIERFNRAIDATADAEQLKALAKQLLQAWQTQKAATQWVLTQQD